MAAALFGVYRNLTSPFGVFGLPALVQPAVNTALNTRLRERLEAVDARVRGFRLAQGRWPATLDELVTEGLTTRDALEGIKLTPSEAGYSLELMGPDSVIRIARSLAISVGPAAATEGGTDPAAVPGPTP